ncbi:MAG: 16S rRNA (cytosine(1402)-N(4))-methyltransferase RsmH [Patescibacteria group bacterium]|nr:16S rRNA (cytosine(1402)-N(4))-methyltransferase RsmH [Patescibacteria group bacterium]
MSHQPVLLQEVIAYLSPQPNQNFIDCTIGGGGHAFAILEKTTPLGKVLGIDLNSETIQQLNCKIQTSNFKSRLILVNDNFINLSKIVEKYNFYPVHGILLDLGLSTDLLEKSGRGFSFQEDEFLDMRYGQKGKTAYEIINQWPEEELKKILKEYGEEKLAWPIARNIFKRRQKEKIRTTRELVEVINDVLKKFKVYNQKFKIKTLARVFQAFRIAVNDELENLKKVLPSAIKILEKDGCLLVISYHSLEDKIVKDFFKTQEKEKLLKILTKKPVQPTDEEIKLNPRSRSAKLRAGLKL